MISCVFEKILNYNTYILKTENQEHELVFEFYGINKPKVGDKILIHEDLLNKTLDIYTQPYAFELQKGIKASIFKEKNDADYITLKLTGKNYVLKRVYG